MTHREFRTWHEWLKIQWNTPSRTDHYLMKIAKEIRSIFNKNVKEEHFLAKFVWTLDPKTNQTVGLTKDQVASMAVTTWKHRLGNNIRVVKANK